MSDEYLDGIMNRSPLIDSTDKAVAWDAVAEKNAKIAVLVKALEETQKVLSVLISPGNERISSMHIWTQAVAAETGARIALASVRDDKP